jgi:ATP-dependent DNA ligase
MDTNGKIRVWDVRTGFEDGKHFYETCTGIKDGSLTYFKTYVTDGKNIGRSNETSAKEQCEAEAVSLRKKQIERKGYSVEIPENKPVLPMLAKEYQSERERLNFPCMVQPKLDGCRVLAHINSSGVKLISRHGKEFFGLSHITDELTKNDIYKKYGDTILDGELFSKELTFQQITSLVKKTVNMTPESTCIQMWVYDTISSKPYHERYTDLSYIISGMKNVVQTPTFIIKSEKEIDYYHKKFTGENFEGTMIRNINGLYKTNSRSSDLLKYKDFIDEEFEVVSYKTGKGKYSNVPTFILKTKNGYPFEAVPIGTQDDRENYLKNADKYIGTLSKVKFFEYTDGANPVPRFPVIIEMDRIL